MASKKSHLSFSQKGEIYLELHESDAEPMGKIMILKEPPQTGTNLQAKHLLQSILTELWALSSADTDKIKSFLSK